MDTDRIEKSIFLDASVERVWRALTDSKESGSWFGVQMDGPFVAGRPASGRLTVAGYEHLRMQIEIVNVDPQTSFSFRWHPFAVDANVDYSTEEPTLVEFRLAPRGDGVQLTVSETGFDRLPARRREEAFRMNSQGWAEQTDNIARHVAG
jgi:uncharacterized protein YndB with AHSA1/START domain